MKKIINSFWIKEIAAGTIGLIIGQIYEKLNGTPSFMNSMDMLFYVIIPVFMLVSVAYLHFKSEMKEAIAKINEENATFLTEVRPLIQLLSDKKLDGKIDKIEQELEEFNELQKQQSLSLAYATKEHSNLVDQKITVILKGIDSFRKLFQETRSKFESLDFRAKDYQKKKDALDLNLTKELITFATETTSEMTRMDINEESFSKKLDSMIKRLKTE